jgi:glycosyltransferase domain-containing protein
MYAVLTVLVPTRNRPVQCAALLRFYSDNGLIHPILVADSSDSESAEKVCLAASGVAEYRHFSQTLRLVDKLLKIIPEIGTPFIAVTPDDDITLPHAIEASLSHLKDNRDFIAAHGYLLNFAIYKNNFDVHGVSGFTPTIGEADPLRRHYHLMRRYQPFYWGVFRTEILAAALAAAQAMQGIMFRELTVMNIAILHGKVARLPVIYGMRGTSQSHTSISESHPLHWFLRDAQSFVEGYRTYRDNLARKIRDMSVGEPREASIEQLLDIVHGIFLQQNLAHGIMNHEVRRLLGDPLPAVPTPAVWSGWHEPEWRDLTHRSKISDRRYVWRSRVLKAEPRDEIVIHQKEISKVEQQLDFYSLSGSTVGVENH